MTDGAQPDESGDEHEDLSSLPRHLSALIGALSGPSDLATNHDKYLVYPDRGESDGAASA
jgi:hypothetical protein